MLGSILRFDTQRNASCRLEVAAGDEDFVFAAECVETSHQLKGLQPNTAYRVRIAAATACGHPGDWSEVLTVSTPALPPLAPTDVVIEAQPGSIRKGKPTSTLAVRWEAGAEEMCAHAAAAFFEAEALDAATRAVRARHMTSKPVCVATLPGLQPGTTLSVRVRAVAAGALGVSNWSAPVRVTTPAPPSLMPVVSLGSTPRTMSAEFGAVETRCALEVQSQSSEGCEGGTPRCSGGASSTPSAAAAAPPRKPSPADAPAPRKRAAASMRLRAAACVGDAPTAHGPPRRRGKPTTAVLRHRRRAPMVAVALTAFVVALVVLAAVRRA